MSGGSNCCRCFYGRVFLFGVMDIEPNIETGLATCQGEMFPELGVLEAARLWQPGKAPEVTGKALLKDWERCGRVADALLLDVPQRQIARQEGMGRHSIRKVMEVLEERGLLAPQKKRMSRRLGHIAEAIGEDLMEMAEAGTLPAQVKPIAMAIALDKKALLDGEASQVIEVRRVGVSIEALEAEYERLRLRGKVIDVESVGLVGNGGVIGGVA